jgi:hypothetical protein
VGHPPVGSSGWREKDRWFDIRRGKEQVRSTFTNIVPVVVVPFNFLHLLAAIIRLISIIIILLTLILMLSYY